MIVEETGVRDGVQLRPLLPEHVGAAYVGWLNDPEVIRFTEVRPGETVESVTRYVADAVADVNAAMWRIVATDRHVGNIRLSAVNFRHHRAEVALMIGDRGSWGQGIATAAIALVADYAIRTLGLHRLEAGVLVGNEGSRRAFEKAGFHLEATLQDYALFEGAYRDAYRMVLIATP